MTAPVHHMPDDLLLQYVAGSAAAPAALVAACHTTMCAACTARVRELEVVGGALLAELPGEALRPGALEATLARLNSVAAPEKPLTPPVQPADCPPLPRPLLRLIEEAGGLRWGFIAPGVRGMTFKSGSTTTVTRLLRLRPGMTIPLHDHGDLEYTMIFSGALEDAGEQYKRGDVCVREGGEKHVPRVMAGETCVALTVNEGALLPLTLTGRLMKLMSGD